MLIRLFFAAYCLLLFSPLSYGDVCSPTKQEKTIAALENLEFNYRVVPDEETLNAFFHATPTVPDSCFSQWKEIQTAGAANCGIFLSETNPKVLAKCSFFSHSDHFRFILLAKAARDKKIPGEIFPKPLNVFKSADESKVYVVMEKSYGSLGDYYSRKFIVDFAERYCKNLGTPCPTLVSVLKGSCQIDEGLSQEFFENFVNALKRTSKEFYSLLRKQMLYVNALLYLGTDCFQSDLKNDNFLVKILNENSKKVRQDLQLEVNGEHIVVQIGDLGGVHCESTKEEAEVNMLDHYFSNESKVYLTKNPSECTNLTPHAKAILNLKATVEPAAWLKQGQTFIEVLHSISRDAANKWELLQ